jgi:hypothetical protein
MTDEEQFYKPSRKAAPPRKPQPGEFLFEFVRESDYAQFPVRASHAQRRVGRGGAMFRPRRSVHCEAI